MKQSCRDFPSKFQRAAQAAVNKVRTLQIKHQSIHRNLLHCALYLMKGENTSKVNKSPKIFSSYKMNDSIEKY